MIKIERILCPTDLSTESDDALQYAVALARIYEAQLLLLHCSEHDSLPVEQDEEKVESRMNSLFVESLAPHLGLATLNELDWRGLLRNNVRHVGSAIMLEAVVQKIDLIVMSSRRRLRYSLARRLRQFAVTRPVRCW